MGSKIDLKNLRDKHRQFFLVVYAETDADFQSYYCGGGLDIGLSEEGMENARKLSKRFKKNPLKVKKILSSPELRAIQMADFLHDEIKGRLILIREFKDQILGTLEGKPIAGNEVHWTPVADPPQGEPGEVFSMRVRAGLEKAFEEEVTWVLVTHPRVATVIMNMLGLGAEKLARGKFYAIDWPAGQGNAHFREI